MNVRRILLSAGLLALAPLLIGVLVLAASPQRAVDGLQALVQRTTPYTLELKAPSLTWSPLHFSADLLLLRAGDDTSPPVVSVQQFDLSMPLSQRLSSC